jgi:hypothetical protein
METAGFDQFTSSFARTHTRRGALRLLASAALGAGGLTALGHDAGQAKKKRKRKKKKTTVTPAPRATGQRCATGKDCASALCGSGTCLTCSLDADCGSGCFCAQPSGGGTKVCVAIQYTRGAISNCAICASGEICRDAEPGTFDCFKRCGTP